MFAGCVKYPEDGIPADESFIICNPSEFIITFLQKANELRLQ